jgi:uncharacterized protein YjbJ (UPF0337 family)
MQMNADEIKGTWMVFKGKIQEKGGKLTSDDLDVIEGDRKQIVGRVQQRYGYSKEEAQRQVDSWMKSQ